MLDHIEYLGLLMLPIFLYLLYYGHYLNDNEQLLLILNSIMLFSLLFGGWIPTLIYLFLYGYHHFLLLQASRGTTYFRRASSDFSPWIQKLFMVGQNQIKLFIYLIYFWVWIRITSLKSIEYDMGGGTFVQLMSGWNCLLFDWYIINTIWLILLILSVLCCWYLITKENQSQVLYKIYLFKYKLIIDIIITIVVITYHYNAYDSCTTLMECLELYRFGWWVRCVQFWGLPASTLFFFYKRHGVFEERGSSQTEVENEQQQQLNQRIIDRQIEMMHFHQK